MRLVRELRSPLAQAARIATAQVLLARVARDRVARDARRVTVLGQSLEHLNPQAVLARGYAIVAMAAGDIVVDSAQLGVGDAVNLTLARGRADATIVGTKSGSESISRDGFGKRETRSEIDSDPNFDG